MSSIAIHKISGIIQKRKWFMCIRRYVGTFSNDSADSDLPNYKNQEEIDEIVAGYGFNYEPNWKQFD